jgi:DNA methylase/ParB-like nuclease domain
MERRGIAIRRKPSAARLTEAEARQLHEQVASVAIERVSIDSVKSNPRNAKEHPEHQIALIAENIRKFGVTQPILIDENDVTISGHARTAAARRLGLKEIPAIRLTGLSPQEKRAVALADNRLAELGRWNTEMLQLELKELTVDSPELNFDYTIIGFDTAEIDRILVDERSTARPDPVDQLLLTDSETAVTQSGDLWVCGDHRLYCASGLEGSSYRALLAGTPADVAFADPIYSVPVAGPAAKREQAREVASSAGHPTLIEFVEFLQAISEHIANNVVAGAVIYICMDWRRLDELSPATRPHFGNPKDMVVWVTADAQRGSFYCAQHQHIAVYVAGGASAATTFRLNERGRYRSNVWTYPAATSSARDRSIGVRVGPTVKPVALMVDVLRDCSKRGQTVLDPFAGFGTMMIAAERTGRRARLIEIDPMYCDVIVRRWQTITSKTAHLAESNQTFAEVEAEARRLSASATRE